MAEPDFWLEQAQEHVAQLNAQAVARQAKIKAKAWRNGFASCAAAAVVVAIVVGSFVVANDRIQDAVGTAVTTAQQDRNADIANAKSRYTALEFKYNSCVNDTRNAVIMSKVEKERCQERDDELRGCITGLWAQLDNNTHSPAGPSEL
ncbi:hypothetical protein GPECTOR_27g731 [Gonium pectorale]|uniref:Uncharacterized protein n=1 Tax=Gonium pectorale TaxID=33097 RepID=A0A150GGR8_GONPE|nr:hypothetical protein GPECTOR_27g731 [Gonium pectorale]|eukprot:KXZ48560.1 hypothetical protein GPECTOR_27g731 [Gonium pectorale]